MSKNAVISAVVILIVILFGWFLIRPKQSVTPETVQPTQAPASIESAIPSASAGAVMKEDKNIVKITSAGFSVKDITIKVGETVTWMNDDTINHTVNSAVHPTHLVYPPLNLDLIKPGDKKSLTFPQAGTYKYHDHLNPSLTGSVTVQ